MLNTPVGGSPSKFRSQEPAESVASAALFISPGKDPYPISWTQTLPFLCPAAAEFREESLRYFLPPARHRQDEQPPRRTQGPSHLRCSCPTGLLGRSSTVSCCQTLRLREDAAAESVCWFTSRRPGGWQGWWCSTYLAQGSTTAKSARDLEEEELVRARHGTEMRPCGQQAVGYNTRWIEARCDGTWIGRTECEGAEK